MSDLPPANIQCEQALLGAILMDNKALGFASSIVGPEHFHEPLHARIFAEMHRQIANGRPVTPVTLKDSFPDVEIQGDLTLNQYIARIAAEAVGTLVTSEYARTVRDLATMRALVQIGQDLTRAADCYQAPDLALREVWERLDTLRTDIGETTERGSISDLCTSMIQQTNTKAFFVTTGFNDFDRAIAGGWRAGRLYVLGGRPSMGKTVIALSSARRVARKGAGVSIFSLEIDGEEVVARMISDESARGTLNTGIPYRDIVADRIDTSQRRWRDECAASISSLPIQIDPTGGLAMADIEARARMDGEKFARQGVRLGVVIIDYLGLIKVTDRYRGFKVHELGEIALQAKTMAKRLDVAVVLLSQLSRDVEKRDDKRPSMSDLRDSGNIEEHADMVGLLYRPAYYDNRNRNMQPDSEASEQATRNQFRLEMILGKNRLGAAIPVDLFCDPQFNMVEDWRGY